jgi:hypothetical protein
MRLQSIIPFTLMAISATMPSLAAGQYTETRNELVISLGGYRYEEPGLMSLQGIKSGLGLRATKAFPARSAFLRGELRYANGTVDYSSNGTGSNTREPDWYFEGRALIGRDWFLEESTVATYTGIGYRFLFNDGRGITSTGAAGYRRESTYIYLPVGINLRTGLESGAEMIGSLEYNHLLSGNQFTKLSDTGLGYSDLNNKQHDGYGIKLRLSYVTPRWSVGPYLHYWNIADSETKLRYQYGVPDGYVVWEPHNRTMEIGIELSRPF